MAKNKYFTNTEVARRAAEAANWRFDLAIECDAKFAKKTAMKFDTRHLMDLCPLLFDAGDLSTEEEKKAKFEQMYQQMVEDFYTPGKEDPQRPDNERIKPYIEKLFQNVLIDLDDVDWDDEKQVEKVFTTMKATQALGTIVNDFSKASLELFPSHEAMLLADAYGAKAYQIYQEGRTHVSYAGLDDVLHQSLGGGVLQKSTQALFLGEIANTVHGATLSGDEDIVFDPTNSEFMTKYISGEDFTVQDEVLLPGNFMEFNQNDFGRNFLRGIADAYEATSFESVILNAVDGVEVDGKQFNKREFLIINGKPMSDIIAELGATRGLKDSTAEEEASKILREAMLDGKSTITLVTPTFTADGKVQFHQKNVKLDLDKLNEQDRMKNYGRFRRWLHRVGIARIPEKYPNNKTRDENIAVTAKDPESAHNKALANLEDRFIKAFNGIKRPVDTYKGVVNFIPTLTKQDEQPVADMNAYNDKENELDREPIPSIDLGKGAKDIPTEPHKDEEPKTSEKEPPQV